jgi:hypothetical protein
MIAKAGFPLGVLLSVVCACAASAQTSPPPSAEPNQSVGPVTAFPGSEVQPPASTTQMPAAQGPGSFMGYINYERPDCCGPVGGSGPIRYELYSRTGPDIIAGGGFLAGTLDTGWMYEGGGRSLFFNVSQDAAWVVDLGFMYQYNHSGNEAEDFTLLGNSVHVSQLQRTFVTLGAGREYYLWKAANECGPKWRVGWEAGGRYGSARLDLNLATVGGTQESVTDSIGAAYAGLHTDFEWPCCDCCTLLFGFRAEWDYTWMDPLPYRSDVMDVNLMFEAGVRF